MMTSGPGGLGCEVNVKSKLGRVLVPSVFKWAGQRAHLIQGPLEAFVKWLVEEALSEEDLCMFETGPR